MSRTLRQQGFRTYRADIRANVGCTLAAAAQLEERLEEIAQRRGSRVRIVGPQPRRDAGPRRRRASARPGRGHRHAWAARCSRPGAHHASLARSVDLLVRLNRAGMRGLMAEDCVAGACARESFDQAALPLPPRASTSPRSTPGATASSTGVRASTRPRRPVEVRSSHVGMAFDPARHRPRGSAALRAAGAVVSCRSRSWRNCVASRAGARR